MKVRYLLCIQEICSSNPPVITRVCDPKQISSTTTLQFETWFKVDESEHKIFKNLLSKKKKNCQRRLAKGTKIFLKNKKTKSTNILVSDIEVFLKKKKKRSVNMVVSDIRVFQKINIFYFIEYKTD